MSQYHIPELSKQLAAIAEEMLPKFSGQDKVLEVLVRFHYERPTQRLEFGVVWSPFQFIKIVCWNPNNAMLVGYDYESTIENIFDSFTISANHSSTWKHDGLDFFHEILKEPKYWKIVDKNIIDICNPSVDKEFTFDVVN